MATNAISDMLRQKESPASSQRKGGAKGSVAILKELKQLGCVSQDSCPRKTILCEQGNLGSQHTVNSPRVPGTKLKFGKERVHREALSQSVRLMSVVLARPNSGKDHKTRPCTKKDAPAE